MWNKIKPYVISIVISLAVGGLSAVLTMDNMSIYDEIRTPPLSPPSILFPIVWTVLYILMGISAAIIYSNKYIDTDEVRNGLRTYGASLVFNLL